MKRFIVYVACFALCVVITILFGEFVIQKQPNLYKYKHSWMLNNSDTLECLVLGSSHSFYGINPKYISKKSFNLANVSQDFKYDNVLLRKYAPLCKKLEVVVLPISYFSFFDPELDKGDEWWRAINYKKYMDVDVFPDFSKYNFEFSKLSVYSGKIKTIFKGNPLLTCDCNGFGLGYNLDLRSPSWEETAVAAVKRHTAEDMSMYDENLSNLYDILNFCKENSIRVVLVTTPAWKDYYNNLNKEQLNVMYETVEKVVKKFSVEYYDYLSDIRFTEDDFYDGDHLSDYGAEKFTRILDKEINVIHDACVVF